MASLIGKWRPNNLRESGHAAVLNTRYITNDSDEVLDIPVSKRRLEDSVYETDILLTTGISTQWRLWET